jgi:RsiW-degrading membrane proteinase PrsW (M82 family)
MIDKLRQDSFWMGLLLGLLIPALIFGVLKLIVYFLPHEIMNANVFTLERLILISIIPNVLLLRYYLLKLKYDLTGRGIVAITFVIGIVFAILHFLPTH